MDKTGVLLVLWVWCFYLLDIWHVRARTRALVKRSRIMATLGCHREITAVIAALAVWCSTTILYVLLGIWSGSDMGRVVGEITLLGNVMGMIFGWYIWMRVRRAIGK